MSDFVVTAAAVKELREKTGAGMMACKAALTEAQGDFALATEALRKKGIAMAEKKLGRAVKEGIVLSYIHGEGRVGVLIEVNCETDFVARTDQFKTLVRDLAMHVAAAQPKWVHPVDVEAAILDKEREIFAAQCEALGQPAHLIQKISEGRVQKFYEENCLVKQIFVKDRTKTIEQLLTEFIAVLGENISVRRFARYALGEGLNAVAAE